MDRNQRTPMFYCYECNAEMRPLMMPDPHCASCNGTFVEEIPPEAPDTAVIDDPRRFRVEHGPNFQEHEHDHNMPPLIPAGDPVIQLMNALMGGFAGTNPPRNFGSGPGHPASSQRATIHFNMGDGRGRVYFASGGHTDSQPTPELVTGRFALATAYPTCPRLGVGGATHGPTAGAAPPIPMEGLLALLTGLPVGLSGAGGGGQWGDYVFDQRGLDEIMTRLMEQSQGQRPVPAPEDMIKTLPRTIITAGSTLAEKECAVCKDTFTPSETEQVITLPCNPNPRYQHTFHEECIVPWLKQNGTCPVCRFQLVPQPQHHGPTDLPPGADASAPPDHGGAAGSGNQTTASSTTGGIRGLWGMLTGHTHSRPSNYSQTESPAHDSRPSDQPPAGNSRPRPGSGTSPPGSWDSLD